MSVKKNDSTPRLVVPKVPAEPEVSDELVTYYYEQAQGKRLVYAQASAQVLDKIYRDHDFYQRRQLQHRANGYDKGLLYDLRAMAWLVRACQLYVPTPLQQAPLPGMPVVAVARDERAAALAPQVDVLFNMTQPDHIFNTYFSLARGAGVVYALAVKHCIKRIYQDHAYLLRRQAKGRQTEYDPKLVRDMEALAWLIRLAAVHVPEEVRKHPIPPPPPRPNRKQPQTAKAKKQAKVKQQLHDILYAPQPDKP